MATTTELIQQMSEKEKDILRRKFLEGEPDPPYTGMSVMFCFPEKSGLGPVTVRGDVPRIGEIISIRAWEVRGIEPQFDFGFQYRWKVAKVYWCIRVNGRAKDRLLYPDTMTAEVHLKPKTDYWWETKFFIRRLFRRLFGWLRRS